MSMTVDQSVKLAVNEDAIYMYNKLFMSNTVLIKNRSQVHHDMDDII